MKFQKTLEEEEARTEKSVLSKRNDVLKSRTEGRVGLSCETDMRSGYISTYSVDF